MADDDRPRTRTDAAQSLAMESLDSYSRDELDTRIELLEAEIARVRSRRDASQAHRMAADLLFGRKIS